jgi:hypothetical protein
VQLQLGLLLQLTRAGCLQHFLLARLLRLLLLCPFLLLLLGLRLF